MIDIFDKIVSHRRAVRIFDAAKPIDEAKVRHCIELATLAPTSSNMQLWEAYHITDPAIIAGLVHDCLDQNEVKTAQQLVLFVTRQDKYKTHAKAVLQNSIDDIKAHSPKDRQAHRIALVEKYYGKLMPFVYFRCFGIAGAVRKMIATVTGWFRPILRHVSESDMRVTVQKSCALVAQTFMLAMSAEGYDTCPLEGIDVKRIKKRLNLPKGAEVNMLVACGIRHEKGIYNTRFRLPFHEFYHKIES